MSQVLDELDKGQDVHAVDAALKRHEAISTDVHAGVSNSFKHWPFCLGGKIHSGTENWGLLRASCLKLGKNEFGCYEAKIEESEKVEPRTPLA